MQNKLMEGKKMFQAKMYWIHALSSLHVGSGRGVGFIDLPIIRERVTNWPFVPGSSIKGVLSDHYGASKIEDRQKTPNLRAAFGIADNDGSTANSGSLVFSDARIVCFPVRSFFGTFAWTVSPLLLSRLNRDLKYIGLKDQDTLPDKIKIENGSVIVVNDSVLVEQNKAYLEDLDFTVRDCDNADKWADNLAEWIFPSDEVWQAEFKKRFAILPDDVFNFLLETGTEVNARIRIEPDKKLAVKHALWYEEALPAETILSGIVWGDRVFEGSQKVSMNKLMQDYCAEEVPLQLGGNATTGKGPVRCIFSNGGN